MIKRLVVGMTFWGASALVAAALPPGVPAHYPAGYSDIVAAAKKEGRIIVYSTTDTATVKPLIRDFEALYPGVRVEFNDMNSTELYNRYISESIAGGVTADVLWTSAMDLQLKLVNDGFMASYASPELSYMPEWSHYQNQAYGTTYEPIVFVYNKRLLKPEEVPQSHADFARIIKADPARFKGKVTTYDVEKSGVGFNYLTQDVRVSGNNAWDTVKAIGSARPVLQSSTGAMMERISSGENLIGYNIIGSYAYTKAKKDPSIGYVYPKDYTLVLSRLMSLTKGAKNPNAAKLWMDYLLSARGQALIAEQGLYSIRSDVTGEASMSALTEALGDSLKPIPVGKGLLVYLDQAKRLEFLKQWQQSIRP